MYTLVSEMTNYMSSGTLNSLTHSHYLHMSNTFYSEKCKLPVIWSIDYGTIYLTGYMLIKCTNLIVECVYTILSSHQLHTSSGQCYYIIIIIIIITIITVWSSTHTKLFPTAVLQLWRDQWRSPKICSEVTVKPYKQYCVSLFLSHWQICSGLQKAVA